MAKSYNIERGLILEKLPTCPVNSSWLESQLWFRGCTLGHGDGQPGHPALPYSTRTGQWSPAMPSLWVKMGHDGAVGSIQSGPRASICLQISIR